MCTPPQSSTRKRVPLDRVTVPQIRRRSSAAQPARCRWIDDEGHEWLFTREGGTLLVERPARAESVKIRFPDLPSEETCGSSNEAWVLFCTADGYLLRCVMSREAEPMEFPIPERPPGGVQNLNAHVRTFLDPADCGCPGRGFIEAGSDEGVGR